MDSVGLREARQRAERFGQALRADHPGFAGCVLLLHDDSTVMFFRSAFVREQEEWIEIHTEHHDTFVYHREEVQVLSLTETPHDWWSTRQEETP